MKKGIKVTLSALLFPLLLMAQTETQELTLAKAVEFAIENNKQLQVSRKNIDLYKQKVRESFSQGLHQLNV
ncbi:MAG: TolC family protein, partial [Odoribacter sp.]|nr:TolC family protein [Odoribacter sp.]